MIDTIRKRVALQYYRWELTTVIYMLEPIEKVIVNVVFLALLALVLYAGVVYLPDSVTGTVRRISSYVTDV